LFGCQGSGAISALRRYFRAPALFPRICSGVRPGSRMKPGKFQQISPKTSSIRQQLTNQCSGPARDETGRSINDLGWRGSAVPAPGHLDSFSAGLLVDQHETG
jgi:hypothetical protein